MAKKNFNVQIIVSYGDKSSTSKFKIDGADMRRAYYQNVHDDIDHEFDSEIPASKHAKVLKAMAGQLAYEASDNLEYVREAVSLLNPPPPLPPRRRGGR
jgi:hypothetical protein